MNIEFGKIINDFETKRKSLNWYTENIKTFESVLNKSKLIVDVIYSKELERIYLLNKEAFIYVGIISKYYSEDEYAVSSNRGYGSIAGYIKHGKDIYTSEVLVCELTYNSFKGIHKSVFTDVSETTGTGEEWIGFPDIVHNYPYISKYGRYTYKKCFEHCKKLIPSFNLQKIIDDFQGVPMCAAVYKIEGEDGSIGYASYCFKEIEKAHDYARKGIKDHLVYCLDFVEDGYKYGRTNYRPQGLIVGDDFKKIFDERTTVNGSRITDIRDAFQYITYCLININDNPHPNIEDIEEHYELNKTIVLPNFGEEVLSRQVFDRCRKGEFDKYDFFTYSDGKIKWKSEFLVYQIVKKLYPVETVYQYRPMFLKSDKGQLSYDVFICGLNIAIEYQGKQHFSAVDFFGGEEAFRDNLRRDALKAELSKKNGIRLIYIDYTETISEELIKNKIKNVIGNK